MGLKSVRIEEVLTNTNPRFVKTQALKYTREGQPTKTWEMTVGHDTVHVLINKTDSQEILLVKQVRPPVLYRSPETCGEVIEACAGLVDKYSELESTPSERARMVAAEEVHEEVGYSIEPNKLLTLPTYYGNVGMSGITCNPFYCEVTDEDYVGQKLEPSEDIEVFPVAYEDLKVFVENTTNTDATTRALVQWFINNKLPKESLYICNANHAMSGMDGEDLYILPKSEAEAWVATEEEGLCYKNIKQIGIKQ